MSDDKQKPSAILRSRTPEETKKVAKRVQELHTAQTGEPLTHDAMLEMKEKNPKGWRDLLTEAINTANPSPVDIVLGKGKGDGQQR